MSFFSKILGKLGLGKKEEAPAQSAGGAGAMSKSAAAVAAKPAAAAAKPVAAPAAKLREMEKDDAVASAPAAPKAISEVDVVSQLEALAKASPAQLNWKVSIVDLLKLLDLDSSFDARKELATELGCPADLMGDSAKMNTWLHKEVLRKLAANGGNIPKELLD
jgi:hypothetical protein